MREHRDAVMALQAAIVDGRLADTRAMASWLAHHDTRSDPAPTGDHELELAANAVAMAVDLPEAAAGVGRVGRACSACHEARAANVDTMFAYSAPPDDLPTIAAQMARHRWAAQRLWEGVVAPADVAWTEGARVMAQARIDVPQVTHGRPNPDVAELAEQLRGLAVQALGATDSDAKASMYGSMLTTCAGCHKIVRARGAPAEAGRP